MIKRLLFFLLLLLTSLLSQATSIASSPLLSFDSPHDNRLIQYSFTLRNTKNTLITNAQLWVRAPVEETSFQKSLKVKASSPYKILHDEMGNQVLHFSVINLPPFATKIISIQTELELSSQPLLVHHTNLEQFLSPQKYIETEHPEIFHQAQELREDNPAETVHNIFRWVSNSIRYTGYLQNPRGALYALRYRKGDCTEFMALFVALCRANGIPARGMSGYVCEKDSVLQPEKYHNWAEVYLDGVWRIADPQRMVLMKNEKSYIAMHVINESSENPIDNFQRIRVAGDDLNVTMNGL